MGIVGCDLYRCLFFLADVFGASFGGRNCQAIVYRAWCILGVKLDIGFDANDDFREFHLEGAKPGESKDPYDTKLYHKFENVLGRLIKRRYLTLTSVVATLFLSLFIMSIMPQSFFPIMNKPYFRADLIFRKGMGSTMWKGM